MNTPSKLPSTHFEGETFPFVRETLIFEGESFPFVRESFPFEREGFLFVRESLNYERESFPFERESFPCVVQLPSRSVLQGTQHILSTILFI
jgi:hypothetical protein